VPKKTVRKERGELLAAMRRIKDENSLIYDLFYGYKEHPPTPIFYILGTLHRTDDDFVTKEFSLILMPLHLINFYYFEI